MDYGAASQPPCPSTPSTLPCFPRHLWGAAGVQGQELIQSPGARVSLLPPPPTPSWSPEITEANPGLRRILPPALCTRLTTSLGASGEGKMGPRPLWPLTLRGVLPAAVLSDPLTPSPSLLSAGWRTAVGMHLLRPRCLPRLLFLPLPGSASSLCPSCLHTQRVLDP